MLQLFRIASAAYLFAVEENLSMIRRKVDPLFVYLVKVKEVFRRWEWKYVELAGEERKQSILAGWPDLQAFEWRDDAEDYVDDTLPWEKLTSEREIGPPKAPSPVQVAATSLPDAQCCFWLIGEPGAGKSTTLQKLAWLRANELLSDGYLSKPCPVFIAANQFDRTNPFRRIISNSLKVSVEQVNDWLQRDKLWLLIDGMNEITVSEQEHAYRDLRNILREFEDTCTVLTSRKYGFDRRIQIPVFELLPLTDDMILDYLERNMLTRDEGKSFFEHLTSSEPLLLDLARNPLLLRMLTQVVQDGKLPNNRGQLLRLFTSWILSRERKRKQRATPLKERVLAEIAFKMRTAGNTYAPQPLVLEWIQIAVTKWHAEVNVSDLFRELLDNHILEMDANLRVTFFHELVLEYFAALELQRLYLRDRELSLEYFTKTWWFEPVIMLTGLLDKPDELVISITQENIILAARCIASGAKVTRPTITNLLEMSQRMKTKRNKLQIEAIIALLELATDDALRLVVKTLDNQNSSLTPALSQCERPEMAALRLLDFGLTGRKRIRQCLSVFEGKPVSRTIINSPEVAQAQAFLLNGKPSIRDLALIDSIGVPDGIRNKLRDRVEKILERHRLDTGSWRTAVRVAVNQGFVKECADTIVNRVSSVEERDGPAYYAIFVACQALQSIPISHQLALDNARRCLKQQLYMLAIKFIRSFKLHNIIVGDEILNHVQDMAMAGRIGVLVEYADVYGDDIDFFPFLTTAVDQQLARYNLYPLREFRKELGPVLLDKSESIRDVLISVAQLKIMRPGALRGYVRVLGLEPQFSEIGMITTYSSKKEYGFIASMLTEEDIFFHISKVTNLEESDKPKPRDLVRYHSQQTPEHPKHKSATFVTILK
jgi:cold shock CspA family protein